MEEEDSSQEQDMEEDTIAQIAIGILIYQEVGGQCQNIKSELEN